MLVSKIWGPGMKYLQLPQLEAEQSLLLILDSNGKPKRFDVEKVHRIT